MTIYARRNRRSIYRALSALPGWWDARDIVAAADRLMTAPARYVDNSSQIAVVRSTRRQLVLRSF